MKKRPKLEAAFVPAELPKNVISITCDPGQWDNLLEAVYNSGGLLLEVESKNGKEKVVRAWQKTKLNESFSQPKTKTKHER